eukprot:779728-Amphidinium_carterae.1
MLPQLASVQQGGDHRSNFPAVQPANRCWYDASAKSAAPCADAPAALPSRTLFLPRQPRAC